jgi:tetratricopeptide (TPR) repeat protein
MSTPSHLSGAQLTKFTFEELTQVTAALEEEGRCEEAINLYRQWLEFNKTESKHVAWFNFGWLLQKQNLFNDAARAYDQLIDNYADYVAGNVANNVAMS